LSLPESEPETELAPVILLPRGRYRYLAASFRLLPWLGGAGLLAVVPSLAQQGPGALVLLLVLAFPLVILLTLVSHLMHQSQKRACLTLSSAGIRHQTLFYTLSTSWDNVVALEPISWGKQHLLGFRLNTPGQISDPFWFGASAQQQTAIPLNLFGDPEQAGPLQNALKTWAPQLLIKP